MEIFTYALQFLTERDAGHLSTTARGAYRTTKPFFELVSRLRLWDSGFVDVQEIVFFITRASALVTRSSTPPPLPQPHRSPIHGHFPTSASCRVGGRPDSLSGA